MTPTDLYTELLAAENISILQWDLETDKLKAVLLNDDIIAPTLPEENFTQFLLDQTAIHPKDRRKIMDVIGFLRTSHQEFTDGVKDFVFNGRISDSSGEYHRYHARYHIHFRGDRPQRADIFLRNTDREYKKQQELRRKAERDFLTGLFNKGYVRELMNSSLECLHKDKALLVLDMDGFKNVNDTLGHLFGDAVLSDMALSLTEVFDSGAILGRIGGDEFVVLLQDNPDRDRIIGLCEKIRARLRRSFECDDGKKIHVTGSVGIAMFPWHGRTFDELFEHADAALYEAKRRGRDTQVFYTPELQQSQRIMEPENSPLQQRQALLNQPVDFIFRMLYETGDTRVTVRTLLELFAKYFRVQRVVIYQKVSETWFCWFEWHADGVLSAEEAHAGIVTEFINGQYKKDTYGNFAESSDTSEFSGEIGTILKERGIFAFLHSGIMHGNNRIGCVGFEDCRKPHAWTKKEHEVLKTFTDIMGTFLMDSLKYSMAHKGYRRLEHLLDSLPLRIWIKEQDSGRMLYMNAVTRKFLEPSEKNCYKIKTASNRSCDRCQYADQLPRCPVLRLLDDLAAQKSLTASKISWGKEKTGLLYTDAAGTEEKE